MFLLKKIVAPLFYPLTLCLLVMIFGLVLMWFTKRQRSGRVLVTIGVAALALFSSGPVSDRILGPLERTFPPLMTARTEAKWIVVLGGGHTSDPGLPVTSQISTESLARLAEAIRLYRTLPGTKLILTGGAVFDPLSEAEIYFKTALAMGIPSQDLVRSDRARDTEEEALDVRERVGRDPFILVTSAFHMPRAVALFKRLGMNPLPAPAQHLVKVRAQGVPEDFYPSSTALLKAQQAVRESLGMFWSRIRGKL